MRSTAPCLLVVLLGLAVLILVGCPQRSETPVAEGPAPIPDVGGPTPTGPAEPEAEPAEAALTKDMVKNLMASMRDDAIGELLEEIGEESGVEGEGDPDTIRAAFDAAATNEKLDEAVKAHGFSGAEEWVATAKKVFPTLAYAEAAAKAELVGIDEDSEDFQKMVEESEFAEMEGVFEQPTEEDKTIIVDAIKEMIEDGLEEASE